MSRSERFLASHPLTGLMVALAVTTFFDGEVVSWMFVVPEATPAGPLGLDLLTLACPYG